MSIINILPENLANKIAAGEVVERPASVVKELLENSIDAGATKITISIEQSGKQLIQIVDNGVGMTSEDIQLAFERHATSKIKEPEDEVRLACPKCLSAELVEVPYRAGKIRICKNCEYRETIVEKK